MQNIAISYFFTLTIYWSSTFNMCCNNVCHFCRCNIHNSYDFIILDHWSIINTFSIFAIRINTCARIPTVISFACTIMFLFTLTCFIIPFSIWVTCCTIEFAFKITWNMFCHCFNFIFVFVIILNALRFLSFVFLETHIFGDNTSTFSIFI